MRQDPPVDPGGTRRPSAGSSASWDPGRGLPTPTSPRRRRGSEFRRGDLAQSTGTELEWKLFGHDRPSTLSELLGANGFVPDPSETLLVLDLKAGRPFPPPGGVRVRQVEVAADLEVAVGVSRAAFAPGAGWDLDDYLPAARNAELRGVRRESRRPTGLCRTPGTPGPSLLREPVGRGNRTRIPGTRGVSGTRLRPRGPGTGPWLPVLTVDARESSRPILERLGSAVTTIVGWVLAP